MKTTAIRTIRNEISVLILLSLSAAFLLFPAPSGALPRETPNPHGWVTNDTVYAAVSSGGITYIGGEFTYVGPNTGSSGSVNTSTGRPTVPFARVNTEVLAAAPDGSGGWYIGGDFTRVQGSVRNHVAHIFSDGTLDPSWNPNANGRVRALAVSGGVVYAGGDFTTIGGGYLRNKLVALDATTGLPKDWIPDVTGDATCYVSAIAVSGNVVYVGGYFLRISGYSRSSIAAIDAETGVPSDWDPSAEVGGVYTLNVSGDLVYAGGAFSWIGGKSRSRIAALNASTGIATDWNPSAESSQYSNVYAITVGGGIVYAGGSFTTMGSQSRNGLAAINAGGTGTVTTWDPNPDGFTHAVHSLALGDGIIYVGGWFTSIGGQSKLNLAAIDTGTGLATSWSSQANGFVYTLTLSGEALFAGGDFTSIGGELRNYLAAIDSATGEATSWNPGADGYVHALAVSGGVVYVGGEFSTVSGETRNSAAAINTGGTLTSWNPNVLGQVNALAVSNGVVYLGGNIVKVGGVDRRNFVPVNATTGALTGWNPKVSGGTVDAIVVSGGKIYIGGYFSYFGDPADCPCPSRYYLASFEEDTGALTAWTPDPNSQVYSLAAGGGILYVGGYFDYFYWDSSFARNKLAAFDQSTGNLTSWNPGADGGVEALVVSGDTVYAGGTFVTIGGQDRKHIAAIEGVTGNVISWSPSLDWGWVYAIALENDILFAGGTFTGVGMESQRFLAQLGGNLESFTLTVTKAGTGSGTVTSSPAGIDCGVDCEQLYEEGTPVTLTATPDEGFTFAGWSGPPDCSDGIVSMHVDKTCTATFNLLPDTTPDPFTFVDQTNVPPSTVIESSAIAVSGINAGTPISITGGQFKIGAGGWTADPGFVNNGQTVTVRQTSAAAFSTTTNATLTIGGVSDTFSVTTAEDDFDGVSAAVEDGAPNGGDGNGDGIPDRLQAAVTSLPAAAGGGYITVVVTGCSKVENVQVFTEASEGSDPDYAYPYGLVGFRIPCSPATVKVIFHGAADLSGYTYRKYGPTPPAFDTPHWYTLSGVTFGSEVIGGATVATATFTLTDGSLGDDTGVDGYIIDQGGPGLPPASSTIYVAKTGSCGTHTPCRSSILNALSLLTGPSVMEITQETYDEDVVLNIGEEVTLDGGWDANFASYSSYTTIHGSITITSGKMILKYITLR